MSELYDAYTTSPLASNISTLIYIAIVLFADLPRAFFFGKMKYVVLEMRLHILRLFMKKYKMRNAFVWL